MTITEETRQVGSTRIKAIKDDRTNWISLEAKGENLTTILVRSGMLGNEAASQTIHREIEKKFIASYFIINDQVFFSHSGESLNPVVLETPMDSGSPLRCARNDGYWKVLYKKT